MRLLPLFFLLAVLRADELPIVANVEHQPFAAQVLRLLEAFQLLGDPLPAAETAELTRLANATANQKQAVEQMQGTADCSITLGALLHSGQYF